MNNWQDKEKYLEMARQAKFVVSLDPPNKWHVIIGGERDLERLVNLIKEDLKNESS